MGILAETFRASLADYVRAHTPTRVLVGGLPDFLIRTIASRWDSPEQLLLVSSSSDQLPPTVRLCRADDLTAERQHTWAALVTAEQSRDIQESIRSAGAGTVRQVWPPGFPWRPCQLPKVRWRNIRDEFIERLGLADVQVQIKDCIDVFKNELAGEVDRGERFFRALEFFENGGVSYADVCFQLGFPSHPQGHVLRRQKTDKDSVLGLLTDFIERFKLEGVDAASEQFRDVAGTRERPDVQAALNTFAREFRHLAAADAENPVRAWRSIFQQHRSAWEVLGVKELAMLLGRAGQKLELKYVLGSGSGIQLFPFGSGGVIVRDRNVGVPVIQATVEFSAGLAQQVADAAARETPLRMFARVNRASVELGRTIPAGAGPHLADVHLAHEGKQSLRLFIGPNSSTDYVASTPSTLWECCQDYPFIVATSGAPVRAAKRKRSKDENGNLQYEVWQDLSLPAPGRVVLQGFIYRLGGILAADLPGESGSTPVRALTVIPNSLCQQFTLTVDALEALDLTFTWPDTQGHYHRATVSFDFRADAVRHQDSMTEILVRAHAGGRRKEVAQQLSSIKTGNTLSPNELPIRDSTKPISRWELQQQAVSTGWWPILASSTVDLRDQVIPSDPVKCLYLSTCLGLNEQANAWRSAIDVGPVSSPTAEVLAYVEARSTVIAALTNQFKLAEGEAIEALNLSRRGAFGLINPSLVQNYLTAATALIHAANNRELSEAWQWRSRCLDSIVLFDDNATAPTAQLFGPWHPLSVARLYFVQQCLTDRLIADEITTLARSLVQTEPLALGFVLDGQLQPSNAIAYPSGDPHWVWIYRQQAQSELPQPELVAWLRTAGLDPQIGPLGVDPDVLPQTLKQYVLAYPSRQTLRLLLDDCSQRTYEALHEEMKAAADLDGDSLRLKIRGGLSVYDRVAKIERDASGDLLSYEPGSGLRWHHGEPLDKLPLDLATLPRSHRVDFQSRDSGGCHSSSMPIARRGLVEYTSAGLEVATALPTPETAHTVSDATTTLVSALEPVNQQLSWGTSLMLTSDLRANWSVCSAGRIDLRFFVEYVQQHPGTALWTYRLFSVNSGRTREFGTGHFLLARVSETLAAGLAAQLSGAGLATTPNTLLKEIAEAGLTLGDEFLRTGRTAEGALGQYLIQRLLWRPEGDMCVLQHWTFSAAQAVESTGFLLQVDPFENVLEALSRSINESASASRSRQRSDIVSFHLQLCDDELWIRPVVFESKFLRGGQTNIENAYAQAVSTAEQIDHLLEFCLHDESTDKPAHWAQPERLLLAELIHLGLRLARGSFNGPPAQWRHFERLILGKVLSGEFRRDDAQAVVVVHHPGQTINNLSAEFPHTLVGFADANGALNGNPSPEYLDIQKSLEPIVRHNCHSGPLTQLRPSIAPDATVKPPAEPDDEQASQVETPPPQPVSAERIDRKEMTEPADARSDTQALGQAHVAFEAAFSDFIGNRSAIEKLRDDLVDALIQRPPHLPSAYLLTGNPSTGKTTLANKIAKLLGVTFVKLVGTNIRTEADVVDQVDNAFQVAGKKPHFTAVGSQGLPEHEYPECLIFIDEIHLVKGRAQEGLLTLTEPKDRYIRLRDRICRFPRATYIAATTRDSEIDRALRTRFGNPIHLKDYTVEEVAEMLAVKQPIWHGWEDNIRTGIARLSRCIPREAERLAQKLERKMKVSLETLTPDAALEKLRLEEGLDRNGLDRTCWDLLRLMAKQTRALGRETLANQMGQADEAKLVSEVIPSLQALGLVEQVAGGQKITDRGRNYLRNEAPPA